MSAPDDAQLVAALDDAQLRALLAYLDHRAPGAVHDFFFAREADAGGQTYSAWGWSTSGPGALAVDERAPVPPIGTAAFARHLDELAAAREDRARG